MPDRAEIALRVLTKLLGHEGTYVDVDDGSVDNSGRWTSPIFDDDEKALMLELVAAGEAARTAVRHP